MSFMKKQSISKFKEKVYEITRKIPKGKTMTYGEVARRAGSPKVARAVGNILAENVDNVTASSSSR